MGLDATEVREGRWIKGDPDMENMGLHVASVKLARGFYGSIVEMFLGTDHKVCINRGAGQIGHP